MTEPRVFHVTMPLPRPPEIAEHEEFVAATTANTPEALRLFIARHPESRWRAEAEKRLEALEKTSPKP